MDPRTFRQAIVKLGVALAMLLVAGCSVMQPPSPPRIEAPPVVSEPPPPVAEPPVAARPPAGPTPPAPSPGGAEPRIEALPRGAPNVPYVVNGERYVPANSDVEMNEIGTASWYGKPFHGRRTANGEVYDMHAMTAAHKTMPLPSYALVRNRDNGKEIVVRINDRGPFKPGRVIAIIINYVKQDDVAGTWLESHFPWQIRTFWCSLLWGGGGPLHHLHPDRPRRSSSPTSSGSSTASSRAGCA